MNRTQNNILLVGIICALVVSLFPPWVYTYKRTGIYTEKPAGYFFVLSNPSLETLEGSKGEAEIYRPEKIAESRAGYGIRLDVTRLIIHWITIVLVLGGLLLFFRGSFKTDRKYYPKHYENAQNKQEPKEVPRPKVKTNPKKSINRFLAKKMELQNLVLLILIMAFLVLVFNITNTYYQDKLNQLEEQALKMKRKSPLSGL